MTHLDGIRVVVVADRLTDLGGRILADLGADVVLVEERQETTAPRRAAWLSGMRAAEAPLAECLAEADVFLDGRRRGAAEGAEANHPETLIHVVAHPGIGTDDAPQTDLTLMAASGLMTVIGDPDMPPLRLPGEQGYALAGIQVATAALLGLAARRRTGRGQRIDVSATQAATLANYREAVMYDWTGRVGHRTGNRLVRGSSGVRQVWPCADGHVTWSMIDNPGMMRSIVGALEAEGVAGELSAIDWDAILVAETEQETVDRWQAIFADYFVRHDKATLGRLSLQQGWGLSPISTLADAAADPHLEARGLWGVAGEGGTRLPRQLFRFVPSGGGGA